MVIVSIKVTSCKLIKLLLTIGNDVFGHHIPPIIPYTVFFTIDIGPIAQLQRANEF